MSIPKIFFTYWEGDQLSILHYYTIFSLTKFNPDTEIWIYTSSGTSSKLIQWTTHEHSVGFNNKINLDFIQKINPSKIHIKPVDFESSYGADNNISVVFKADFIRIAKLHEHGGMWFDMDILFIKSIPEYIFNSDLDFYYFTYLNAIPTGLLFVSPQKSFLKDLYANALSILQRIKTHTTQGYQVLGPDLWKAHFNHITQICATKCLKTSDVYPYDCETIPSFYSNKNMIEDNTFGVHWYNGHPMTKRFINTLNISQLDENSPIIIERLLYNVIHS